MADEEQKEERVELGDVVRVLAKYASVPNDPDDADLIGRFNAQVAEEQAQEEPQEEEGEEARDEEKEERYEGPQQGSPPVGSPTERERP